MLYLLLFIKTKGSHLFEKENSANWYNKHYPVKYFNDKIWTLWKCLDYVSISRK